MTREYSVFDRFYLNNIKMKVLYINGDQRYHSPVLLEQLGGGEALSGCALVKEEDENAKQSSSFPLTHELFP
jgi:hypothetical protein